jgi:hypothetical protein
MKPTALQNQIGSDVASLFLTIGMVTVVLNFRLMLFIHQSLMALLMPYLFTYIYLFVRKESRLKSCIKEVFFESTLIRERVAQCF